MISLYFRSFQWARPNIKKGQKAKILDRLKLGSYVKSVNA